MTRENETNIDPALFGALEGLGDEPWQGEADDHDILAAAFANLDAGVPGILGEPEKSGPSRLAVVIAITTAVGLVAAAALLLFLLRPGTLVESGEVGAHSLSKSVAEITDDVREATASDVKARHRANRSIEAPKQIPEPQPQPQPQPLAESDSDTEGDTDDAAVSDSDDAPKVRRPAKAKTADDLLRRAQGQLADGNRKAAQASYQRLITRFSKSAEAKAAMVSLGRIELQAGRAKQALSHFDAYLAAGSRTLRQEARYGRIRALRKLGRRAQEKASIESFLADHPKSLYASRLRQRLTEIKDAP